MITEDYVSFEIAKLLKSKGFDSNAGDTSKFYMPSENKYWNYNHYHDFDKADRIECPTLQMAMKWLREVHKIHINTVFLGPSLKWTPTIWEIDMTIPESKHIKSTFNTWESYEDACEAAIKYCLENLI